jgi:hypothetical protein
MVWEHQHGITIASNYNIKKKHPKIIDTSFEKVLTPGEKEDH